MNIESTTRPYRQSARAKAAEETAQRILGAFLARMQSDWFEEIRLEDVAADAGVSVQTVIRRFGGKEGLLDASRNRMREEILSGRELPPGDVDSALTSIIFEYEAKGELMMRALAQEDRYPQIKSMTDEGRATHRAWVGKVFDPWLDSLDPAERRHAHDRLVVALDLYIWKLVRLDMKRTTAELRRAMLEMAAAALHTTTADLLQARTTESSDA